MPAIVKEYCLSLLEEEVKFLLMRLEQRFQGDEAEALLFLQKHDGVDSWLKSANNHVEFAGMLAALQNHLEGLADGRRRPAR